MITIPLDVTGLRKPYETILVHYNAIKGPRRRIATALFVWRGDRHWDELIPSPIPQSAAERVSPMLLSPGLPFDITIDNFSQLIATMTSLGVRLRRGSRSVLVCDLAHLWDVAQYDRCR